MDGWVWSNGGMILTGENWSSVCGRWMNGYGVMVEWYWQENTEVLGEKYYTAWVVGGWMSMDRWWNGTDRGNWSAGRKILYRVGGRWMNGYGAMVKWYWPENLKFWQKDLSITIPTWTLSEFFPLFELSDRRLTSQHVKLKSCFHITLPARSATLLTNAFNYICNCRIILKESLLE